MGSRTEPVPTPDALTVGAGSAREFVGCGRSANVDGELVSSNMGTGSSTQEGGSDDGGGGGGTLARRGAAALDKAGSAFRLGAADGASALRGGAGSGRGPPPGALRCWVAAR